MDQVASVVGAACADPERGPCCAQDIEAHMRKHNIQPVDEFWLTPGGRYSVSSAPSPLHPGRQS